MKVYYYIFLFLFGLLFSCNSNQNLSAIDEQPKLVNDTIRIANEEIEYEVTVIDPAFTNWFNSNARPRSYYTQNYLEARNIVWVTEWNRRVLIPSLYDPSLYEMQINYDSQTNYGFEVNYMIYNYLTFFQLHYNQRLGGYTPRR